MRDQLRLNKDYDSYKVDYVCYNFRKHRSKFNRVRHSFKSRFVDIDIEKKIGLCHTDFDKKRKSIEANRIDVTECYRLLFEP